MAMVEKRVNYHIRILKIHYKFTSLLLNAWNFNMCSIWKAEFIHQIVWKHTIEINNGFTWESCCIFIFRYWIPLSFTYSWVTRPGSELAPALTASDSDTSAWPQTFSHDHCHHQSNRQFLLTRNATLPPDAHLQCCVSFLSVCDCLSAVFPWYHDEACWSDFSLLFLHCPCDCYQSCLCPWDWCLLW